MQRVHLGVLAAIIAVLAVGIAIAAWSVSGSGNGAAKATSASALTLADASAFTTADLYPGATGNLKSGLRTRTPSPSGSRRSPGTARSRPTREWPATPPPV